MPVENRKSLPAAFIRIAWSNLAAQLSEQIALAAAPLVAVLALGADAAGTGLLQTAQTLPFLLLSIPAGVLADRSSQRRLMVGSEALRTLSLLTVLLLIVSGAINLPLLAGLGFVGAIGTVCYNVAAPAFVPTLVPREQLGAANRWLELARSVAYSAGPAVGGAIVGWTGAPAAYVLATVLSLCAVFFLAGLPETTKSFRPRRRLFHELGEGAAFVASSPFLRPILITAVFFNTSWFVLQAVYVAYAFHSLGLTATGIGITLGVYGAGMVFGALVAPRLSQRLPFGFVIAIGPLAGLMGAILMLLTSWIPSGALAALSFFLFGAGPVLWVIATTTLRQVVTPSAMLGRVSALIMTATYGARPIGAAIGALVRRSWALRPVLRSLPPVSSFSSS
jgi:predicted MFS family arabinose efflux permease